MIDIKQIEEPRVLGTIPDTPDWYTISAEMSTMRAHFDNPRELSSGTLIWDLTVYGDKLLKENIEPLWEGLEEDAHCFQVPPSYVPFGYDGGTFCYSLLESGTHIYDFAKDTRKRSKVRGIWSILCAWKAHMILIGGVDEITHQEGVYLVDYSGNTIRRIQSLDDTPDSYLSWLMYKPTILAISKKERTWLSEIDPETGDIIQEQAFAPQDILPYDDLSYSQHLRKNCMVQTETGDAYDGLLRNEWHSYRYEFGFKRLRMRICHPPIEYLLSENRPKTNEVPGIFYEYTFRVEFV